MNVNNFISKSFRITTNTTTNVALVDARLCSLVVNVTGAPTTWILEVRSKEAPAKVIFRKSYSAPSAAPDVVSVVTPITLGSGIDIVTVSGTTATMDVWVTYDLT